MFGGEVDLGVEYCFVVGSFSPLASLSVCVFFSVGVYAVANAFLLGIVSCSSSRWSAVSVSGERRRRRRLRRRSWTDRYHDPSGRPSLVEVGTL